MWLRLAGLTGPLLKVCPTLPVAPRPHKAEEGDVASETGRYNQEAVEHAVRRCNGGDDAKRSIPDERRIPSPGRGGVGVRAAVRGSVRLACLALAAALALPATVGAEEPAPTPVPATTEVVVGLDPGTPSEKVAADLTALGATDVRIPRGDLLVAEVPAARLPALLPAARALDGVAAAGRQGRVRALGVPPDDTGYVRSDGQRHVLGPTPEYPHAVNLEPAWRQAFLGLDHNLNPYRTGVKVAVIDSGVSAHWREDGRFVPVRDYVDGDGTTQDLFGHGTQVACEIAAQTGNGFGVAGVLGDVPCTIEVYRVLDAQGYGTTEDTLRAIMDAADRGCKIINCSLGEQLEGTDAQSASLRALHENAVRYAASRGAIVVAAAGNIMPGYSDGPVMYPAAAPDAIAVGSIDPRTGARSATSSFGPQLDISAPGDRVWLMGTAGVLFQANGTSFAAPIVSGSLALLWSLLPSLPPSSLRETVLSTAVDYPPSAPDGPDPLYGHGRLDVWAAYQALIASVPEQSDVHVSATSPQGFWTDVSWTPASGANVFYRYGYLGGPEYQTSATGARLYLQSDGEKIVYVREFSSDRWANSTLATATVTPATGLPPLVAQRLSGADRYTTAIAVSRASHPTGADAVVVASGANWPDALAAGVLARAAEAPLLLTTPRTLPTTVRDEIVRLKPRVVYVIGGSSAVSVGVEQRLRELAGSGGIMRVAGSTRYSTARAIANRVRALGGGAAPGTAVVASGESFADAVSAASYAARAGYPILLTAPTALPSDTSRALSVLGVRRTVVVGGGEAVSGAVARKLPGAVRVAGKDRYETSRRFAAFAISDGILSPAEGALATGLQFPDALSAAPLMASRGGGVVLLRELDAPTLAHFDTRRLQLRRLAFLGGNVAIPQALEDALKTRLRTP